MLLEEKFMALNTSNNNSDAAPGSISNVNYMPKVLGYTGPVRGTRRLMGINRRHLSSRNERKSNNIVRRRREKFLRTLRAQRGVPVRAQLPVAAPVYSPPPPPVYSYTYNNNRENARESRYVNGINTYDPASFMYASGAGSNTYELRQSRAEAMRQQNENAERERQLRDQELMHYYP